jgi:hypothetical protein
MSRKRTLSLLPVGLLLVLLGSYAAFRQRRGGKDESAVEAPLPERVQQSGGAGPRRGKAQFQAAKRDSLPFAAEPPAGAPPLDETPPSPGTTGESEETDRPASGQEPDPERQPAAYRAGKLPRGLPAWFAQLDRDGDGQVGLYEWKQADRPIDEFEAMDLNGDGFLTAEEVLRFLKAQKQGDGKASVPSGGGSKESSGPDQGEQGGTPDQP